MSLAYNVNLKTRYFAYLRRKPCCCQYFTIVFALFFVAVDRSCQNIGQTKIRYHTETLVLVILLNRKNSRHLTGFHPKLHRRKKRRNSILIMCRYPDLDSASDWSCCEGNLLNSTKHKHYLVMVSDMSSIWSRITEVIPHTSFCRETSDGFAKCHLFSQASDFARWCKHFFIINNKNLHWPMRQIEKTKMLVHRHSFSEATCLSELFETLAVFLYPGLH